tara:strand:- start:523 stop:810 length:288 start_codon:yes stop_codon:yes gene_type:complete
MNLQEYYKHYLSLHQNVWCRRLHVCGQFATILFVVFCLKINLWLLLLAPLVVYPFAWSGHYFFEKNKPAAFRHPIKAKISDWIMFYQWLKGDIKR